MEQTISEKRDNLERLSKISEMNFPKITVPFDFEQEFPEILVKWISLFIPENQNQINQSINQSIVKGYAQLMLFVDVLPHVIH